MVHFFVAIIRLFGSLLYYHLHNDKKQQAEDYIAGLKYKEIAEKYGVTLNTVKSWKTRYSWSKKVCIQKRRHQSLHQRAISMPKVIKVVMVEILLLATILYKLF